MIFSLSIASASLIYGFVGGFYRKPVSTLLPSTYFSSIWFNGVKTKAMFLTMKLAQRHISYFINQHGGSIHRLSSAIPRYKKSPTINFCSSDCFIYCYYNGNLKERIRVTLLTSLDRNLSVPEYAIFDAEELSPFCVNKLVVLGANSPNAPLLLRSRNSCAWCI
ncbi:hypothetical protein THRCLA_21954 [Thraustotheca clavata]|uniref:Uncharacterized protein n=1 Tax=Thraustotheca clavata TaxID=74557 RepID=A0A1V9ZH52_9STRA|nr:hypothetical protein THRCLA_21954 [Thraustotheca clavata]